MSTKKILLIGCAGVAAVGLLLLVGFILFVAHVAKDPEGMQIAVNAPTTVARDTEFELVISVVNERKNQPLQVADIDISEDYLKGFTVVTSEPKFVSSTKNGMLNNRTFSFNQSVAAGGSNTFTFKLLGRKAGKYSGEIDISEGMRMLTMVVETQVE